MTSLVDMARALGPMVMAAFGVTVVLGLLHGSLRTTGLFAVKGQIRRRQTSAERVQLLLFTVGFSAMYLMRVAHAPSVTTLPDVDTPWIASATGSHLLYVVAKAWRRFGSASSRTR